MNSQQSPSLAERRGSNVAHLQHVGVGSPFVNHLQCGPNYNTHSGDRNTLSPRVRLSSNILEDLKSKGIQQLTDSKMDKHMLNEERDQLWGRDSRMLGSERVIDLRIGLKLDIITPPISRIPSTPITQLRVADHPATPTRMNPTSGSLVPGHVPRIRRFSGSGRLMVLSDSGPKILQAIVQNPKIVLPMKTQERLARLRVPSTPTVVHEPIQLNLTLADKTKNTDNSFILVRPPSTTSIESSFSLSPMNTHPKQLPLKRPYIFTKSPAPIASVEQHDTMRYNDIVSDDSAILQVTILDGRSLAEERLKNLDPISVSWFIRLFRHAVSSNIDYCHFTDVNSYQCIESVLYEGVPLLTGTSEMLFGGWWKHLLAGGLAGAVSRTATAPLDRVKVMRMVLGAKVSSVGLPQMFQCMLKEGGAQSLWRGNAMNVIKVVPETALKFAIYEQIKNSMHAGRTEELGVKERFVAGSLAGFVSQTVIYPLEVLKTQMVLRRTGQYSGVAACVRQMFRNNGVGAFYRGYVPNVLGIIPYAGIDLAIYETLKRWYIRKYNVNEIEPSTLVLLACALTSSTCGQLASYPLSLVRTRLQAKAGVDDARPPKMIAEFRHIYRLDGFRGMYRGLGANFLKVAPAVGISYIVYEHVRSSLGVKMT